MRWIAIAGELVGLQLAVGQRLDVDLETRPKREVPTGVVSSTDDLLVVFEDNAVERILGELDDVGDVRALAGVIEAASYLIEPTFCERPRNRDEGAHMQPERSGKDRPPRHGISGEDADLRLVVLSLKRHVAADRQRADGLFRLAMGADRRIVPRTRVRPKAIGKLAGC